MGFTIPFTPTPVQKDRPISVWHKGMARYLLLTGVAKTCYTNLDTIKYHSDEFKRTAKDIFIELCLEDGVEFETQSFPYGVCCSSVP